MKLSLLHERSPTTDDLLNASGVRPFQNGGYGSVGSMNYGSQINAIGTSSSKKKLQDPNYPERLTSAAASGNNSPEAKMLPFRSGSQDTPLKPRHRMFFNSPAAGRSKKGGYVRHGKPIGSWPPANQDAPIGVWGKRPGVKDI